MFGDNRGVCVDLERATHWAGCQLLWYRLVVSLPEEARRLAELYADHPRALIGFLSQQLSVVKSQAQMLVGLCGLAITVTGFSGAHMIRAGSAAAISMVLGIALILVGLTLCLLSMSRLRWVTQDLCDDLQVTVLTVIARRNAEQRNVMIAALFVALGLTSYLAAVVIAALISGNARG